jgi:hypothetical protein
MSNVMVFENLTLDVQVPTPTPIRSWPAWPQPAR